jgi:hypothetical protein
MTERPRPPNRPPQKHRRHSERDPDSRYDVGYGKPPEHTRFRPGKSGNPKGRPKLRRNLKTVLGDALSEPITIREGERRRTTSRLDALVRTVLTRALQGEAKVIPHLIALIRMAGLVGDEPETAGATPIGTEDEALIRDFLRRFGGGLAEASEDPEDIGSDDQSPTRDDVPEDEEP